MGYFIPFKHTDRDIFKDEGNPSRYLRVVVGTGEIRHKFTPIQISCSAEPDYQKWSMSIKNRGSITVGWLADEPVVIQVSTDDVYWYTLFTGYVSDAGFNRTRGYVTDDYISLDMVDATQRKGTKRKLTPALLTNFMISNPDNLGASIIHYLASKMGVDLEVFPIAYVKDILSVGDDTVWSELQKLKEAFGADMYFNHLGQLRFVSQFDSSKTLTLFDGSSIEQTVTITNQDGDVLPITLPSQTQHPEWIFQGDPDHVVSGNSSWIKGKVGETYLPIQCNRAKSEFIDYEQLTSRELYRNTEQYDEATKSIEIVLQAGEYWPGPAAADIARLEYKDPETGEDYPYALDVSTPSMGSYGSGSDIEYTGGNLQIVSFNGSTSATRQNPDSSEIILHNAGSTACTIRRLRIIGVPYRNKAKEIVEYVDSSIMEEVDYVDKTVDGKYVVDKDQIYTTLYDIVENEKNRVRHFSFSTAFLPWIQRGAIVEVQMPGESPVRCRVDSYQHQNRGRTLQGMVTSLVCTGKEVYTPTGTASTVTVPSKPAIPGPPGLPGDAGAPAMSVTVLSSSDTLPTTSRGTNKIASIVFTAQLQNIIINQASDIAWSCSDPAVSLAAVSGDMSSVVLNTSQVSQDTFIVSATVEGVIGKKAIAKVADGPPAPFYAGVRDSASNDVDGEALIPGDCFLYIPADVEDPKYGHVLRYNGAAWVSTTDSYSIGVAAKDAFKIARETGKVIYAAVIYTEAMVAANIQVGSGTGNVGSGFRFRAMDDDYSQEGSPKVPVFDLYKDDKQLFKVDVSNGNIYFGAHFWYNPADGAIHTPNDKTVIKADGTIEAVDGVFSGAVNAEQGVFKGSIDSSAFASLPSSSGTTDDIILTSSEAYQVNTMADYCQTTLTVNKHYACSVTIDSSVEYIRYSGSGTDVNIYFYNSSFIEVAVMRRIYGTWLSYDSDYKGSSLTVSVSYGAGDVFKFKNLPTSASGLASGQVWRDGTTLKIVT